MAYQKIAVYSVKFTKSFTDFTTAGLTNTIAVGITLPVRAVVRGVSFNPETTFSGGAIASYKISIGKAGTVDSFLNINVGNIFTGAVFGGYFGANVLGSLTLSTPVEITATTTGANLDQATQGEVDVWVFYTLLD